MWKQTQDQNIHLLWQRKSNTPVHIVVMITALSLCSLISRSGKIPVILAHKNCRASKGNTWTAVTVQTASWLQGIQLKIWNAFSKTSSHFIHDILNTGAIWKCHKQICLCCKSESRALPIYCTITILHSAIVSLYSTVIGWKIAPPPKRHSSVNTIITYWVNPGNKIPQRHVFLIGTEYHYKSSDPLLH